MKSHRKTSGVALLIVLVCVLMLTMIIVGFMLASRNAMNIATMDASREESRALSELALDLVMGQIREATLSGPGVNAWASQPGAIRVWDQQGTLEKVYKLYSASSMQASALDFLNPATGDVPQQWATLKNQYVDLNTPVKTGTSGTWVYPVLDPITLGADGVSSTIDGFRSSLPVAPNGASTPWDSRAAMPVRWLYVLQDGTLIAPDVSSVAKATFASSPTQPSAANPIVGRVAFWTDDESCKVNVNTASGTTPPAAIGYLNSDSYWDMPMTTFQQDYNYGRSMPVEGEFQRYPGHPATVNLLSVLSSGTLKNIFTLTPRYKWGGSTNGTTSYISADSAMLTGSNAPANRLYASVDELQFQPHLTGVTSGATRVTNPISETSGGFSITPSALDAARFFLTARSRASDLNLFGRPRVTIWPVSAIDDANHRTVYDRLIAFCSTIGTGAAAKPYYFVRGNALSQTDDWLDYQRNQDLFGYLENLTKTPIPGYGGGAGGFLNKYDSQNDGQPDWAAAPGEWAQILTEIFDYIRCIHLNETWSGRPAGFVSYTTPVTIPPSASSVTLSNYPGAGFVLPITINQTPVGGFSTRGAGRTPTLSESALVLIQRALAPTPPATNTSGTPHSNQIQTGLFFETFSPMLGYMPWVPPTGLSLQASMPTTPVKVNGENVFLGSGTQSLTYNASAGVGGADGFSWTFPPWGITSFNYAFCRLAGTGNNIGNAISIVDIVSIGGTTIPLTGGEVKVSLNYQGTPYQTFTLNFPDGSLPIPAPAVGPPSSSTTGAHYDWANRYTESSGKNVTFTFREGDVVHSIAGRDGDYRIAAYLPDVPADFFIEQTDFGKPGSQRAHSLMYHERQSYIGSVSGGFVKGAGYQSNVLDTAKINNISAPLRPGTTHPKIDSRIDDLILSGSGAWAGDWENGMGYYPDGAYLRKSDEGSKHHSGVNYFSQGSWSSANGFFSPNREMPSAVMFGALPTGVKRTYQAYKDQKYSGGRPWRTLLFCPNPDILASGGVHFGFGAPSLPGGSVVPEGGFTAPPDRLLLDLFTMPVVEPYAISDSFATAGRINMNTQIVPFTGIKRETGLYAVLSSQRIPAIASTAGASYKLNSSQGNNTVVRLPVNIPETLKQFQNVFEPDGKPQNGDIFHSATDICSVNLIPTVAAGTSPTLSNITDWWKDYRLTGDNLRERPYSFIYPLLTTKSNVYTVHVWAQSLKKVPTTPVDDFVEGKDQVMGEYRGRMTFERYLDPNDSRFSDGTFDSDSASLESLYRYRVIETKQFAP